MRRRGHCDAVNLERASEDIILLRHDRRAGRLASYLLVSDVHWDSPYCDRVMLARHLDYAKSIGAGVLFGGDLFDAMQGKNDRRGSKGSVRPEFLKDDYFDQLVLQAGEWFKPYRDLIVMIGDGNHETSVLKHNERDLSAGLARILGVEQMGYSGFVVFLFADPSGGNRASYSMVYHHGAGGGGPITKGMIGNSRRSMSIDADVFWTGHIHESTYAENEKVGVVLLGNGKRAIRIRTETHLTAGGYKQEFSMRGGFHVEKGRPPKPLGGWWLHFEEVGGKVIYRCERAK